MNALTQKLIRAAKDAAGPIQPNFFGRVSRFDGHIIECDGFPATIGTLCWIETRDNGRIVAEVIGFQNKNNLLCVHETGARISVGAKVSVYDDGYMVSVGEGLLGRVIDSLGQSLDGKAMPKLTDNWPIDGVKINPLARKPVNTRLDVGVRVINSLLTVGQGQRLGIIAGSGVGKSILLSCFFLGNLIKTPLFLFFCFLIFLSKLCVPFLFSGITELFLPTAPWI